AMKRLLGRLDPGLCVPEEADGRRPGTAQADGRRPGLTEAECIDLLRELEDLKAAATGAQAAVTAHLSRLRLDAEQAAGVPAERRGRGLGSEVALARRLSPHHGGRHLGMARALRDDMPCT